MKTLKIETLVQVFHLENWENPEKGTWGILLSYDGCGCVMHKQKEGYISCYMGEVMTEVRKENWTKSNIIRGGGGLCPHPLTTLPPSSISFKELESNIGNLNFNESISPCPPGLWERLKELVVLVVKLSTLSSSLFHLSSSPARFFFEFMGAGCQLAVTLLPWTCMLSHSHAVYADLLLFIITQN